jgi:hypothetical protein
MRHSNTKGELDEPAYNIRHGSGVSGNVLLLTWI